jgi:hypothetical protein
MIPFGEWLPDYADLENPGTPHVNNVLPAPSSYRPIGSVQAISDALAETPIGGGTAQKSDGVVLNVVGTPTGLFKLENNTWIDVTNTVGAYSTASDERWNIAQFGEVLLATNFSDVPQKMDLTFALKFEDLGGSPPKARHIAIVRDFVVLGNLSTLRNGIQWSAFNDAEGWTIGTDQSDFQSFPDGGWVQGILGGEQGYIFLERAIVRMTATGDEFVFQFDVVEQGRGLRASGSLVQVGGNAFFLANDGFYQFNNGQSAPIGAHKVDKTFFANVNETFLPRMSGVADPINKLVIWSYASKDSVRGDPDKLIIYNWATGAWSQADLDASLICPILTPGYTLEALDGFSSNLESLEISLDSRLWTQGALALGVYGLDNTLGLPTGPNLEAELETKEAEIFPGARAFVSEVRPLIDTDKAVVSVGHRETLHDTPAYSSQTAMSVSGRCPARSSGRYQRARIKIPAGATWTHAQGVDFTSVREGVR